MSTPQRPDEGPARNRFGVSDRAGRAVIVVIAVVAGLCLVGGGGTRPRRVPADVSRFGARRLRLEG